MLIGLMNRITVIQMQHQYIKCMIIWQEGIVRENIMPMTTRLSNGFPPCLFSSSARMLSCCLLFPAGRVGVGAAESSFTADGLDGVSVVGAAVTSGLGPLRTDGATRPFSSALYRQPQLNISS